ncbi:MAG: helix-turn-helix domain-containing protein, partial [Caulobacteraceae bacterium]
MLPDDPRINLLGRSVWGGLEVNLTTAPAGRFDVEPRPEHRLLIHCGAPARVTFRDGFRGRSYVQRRGDIDLVPAGLGTVFEDADPTSLIGIWLSPSFVASAANTMCSGKSLEDAHIKDRDETIYRMALMFRDEIASASPSDPLYLDSLSLAFVTRLLERWGAPRRPSERAALSKPKLTKVLEFIEDRLEDKIRIADLSDLIGLSPSHFQVLFRQTLHRPVHAYVIERRLAKAKLLLEKGEATISEAALASGFS